jgi:hypothetical protein
MKTFPDKYKLREFITTSLAFTRNAKGSSPSCNKRSDRGAQESIHVSGEVRQQSDSKYSNTAMVVGRVKTLLTLVCRLKDKSIKK